jgi:hypothetical protein
VPQQQFYWKKLGGSMTKANTNERQNWMPGGMAGGRRRKKNKQEAFLDAAAALPARVHASRGVK